jgi:hypothetical protein
MNPGLLTAPPAPVLAPPPSPPAAAPRRVGAVVGFAWLRHSLQATVFVRQAAVASWTAPGPVRSFEEFEAAVAAALAALGAGGGDAFLLLEQAELRHRTETAPAYSAKAARSYLAARIARQEESGAVLWCAQPTATARQDTSFLLHLLPAAFFERVDRCFAARGLRLSRIFPLAVPLALELLAEEGRSRLIAVETDGATTIAVAAEGRLAFARTIEASWSTEAARVGMEVNRSLFYAKQQLGAVVQQVTLLGAGPAIADVRERCGAGREITAGLPCPADWLQRVASLSPRHPQNLLAALRQRQGRQRWARAAVAAAGWMLLVTLATLAWKGREAARADHRRFAALQREEGDLRSERAALLARDRAAERDRVLLEAAAEGHRPPVPLRTLAGVAGLLPAEIRLTDFQIEWEPKTAAWSFHLGGTIAADEDTARSLVNALQDKIGREPWQAQLSDAERTLNPLPAVAGEAGPGSFSFTLGGTLP